MPTFIYVLRPQSRRLIDEPTRDEEARLGEHFDYLETALVDGRLILAGPCLDGGFGVVLFRAPTEDKALESMQSDPVVRHGPMSAELHAFRVSLMGTG